MRRRASLGTAIGLSDIKQRRLTTRLDSQSGLCVGDCVPFYFCPRSVMLFVIHRANHPKLGYRGGQGPIVHLEADLRETVDWADRQGRRWAFTLSNAGSRYFQDRCDLAHLDEIDREAVRARDWQGRTEGKQAEFLIEHAFPWELVHRVGVLSAEVRDAAADAVQAAEHQPAVTIRRDWYY